MCQAIAWACGHITNKPCPKPKYSTMNTENLPVIGLKCPGQPVQTSPTEYPCYPCILEMTRREQNEPRPDLPRAYALANNFGHAGRGSAEATAPAFTPAYTPANNQGNVGQGHGPAYNPGNVGQGYHGTPAMAPNAANNPYLRRGAVDFGQDSNLRNIIQQGGNSNGGSIDLSPGGGFNQINSSHPGNNINYYPIPAMSGFGFSRSSLYPYHPQVGAEEANASARVAFNNPHYNMPAPGSVPANNGTPAGEQAGHAMSPGSVGVTELNVTSTPLSPPRRGRGILARRNAWNASQSTATPSVGVIGDRRQTPIVGDWLYSPSVASDRSEE